MTDWKEVVDTCGPMVICISWRILGNSADVEDNIQDVFLEACRIHERTTIRHWRGLLRRLATLGALAKRRQRRHHVSLGEVLPLDVKTPAPEETAIRRELETKLAMRSLHFPNAKEPLLPCDTSRTWNFQRSHAVWA